MRQYIFNSWDKNKASNWIALNQDNKEYQKLGRSAEQIQFLEKKLIENILNFAKGLNWNVEKNINCIIAKTKNVSLGHGLVKYYKKLS
ncbi:MAG: CRISPR-associated endonuclease Cas6 [Cytophagales bacterium]|nr:CRISPR-associated endonuclease Cas6 [Cytophagales bacterium]MDW8383766.1 CRISPR-associated endonuclease Cas6 [Flammeovirgaceae bacterium]